MPRLVEKLKEAVESLLEMDKIKAKYIINNESLVNALEIKIDEECSRVLATR